MPACVALGPLQIGLIHGLIVQYQTGLIVSHLLQQIGSDRG